MVTRRADSNLKERLPTTTVAREANGCRGRPAQGRSPCMEQGHVRAEDPEGGIPRRAARSKAARSAAAAAQRRRRGGTHQCPWGMVERRGWNRGAGRNARARRRAVSLREKGDWDVCLALFMGERVQLVHGQTQTQTQVVLVLSESGFTRTRPVSRVGPVRVGSDRDGRERPAADRGGPVRSDRKEPRSSRVTRPFGTRSITGRTI